MTDQQSSSLPLLGEIEQPKSDTGHSATSLAEPSTALLPCPFCGDAPELVDREKGPLIHGAFVGCNDCGATQPIVPRAAEAVSAWNRREAPCLAAAGVQSQDVRTSDSTPPDLSALLGEARDWVEDASSVLEVICHDAPRDEFSDARALSPKLRAAIARIDAALGGDVQKGGA